MAEKLIGELLVALIEVVTERLIVYLKLENTVEIVTSFGGLALMALGIYAKVAGWW